MAGVVTCSCFSKCSDGWSVCEMVTKKYLTAEQLLGFENYKVRDIRHTQQDKHLASASAKTCVECWSAGGVGPLMRWSGFPSGCLLRKAPDDEEGCGRRVWRVGAKKLVCAVVTCTT